MVKRIVERTVNENKRIINKQELEALEAKNKKFKVSSSDFLKPSSSESSSSSSSEESVEDKPIVKISETRKIKVPIA